MTNQTAQPQHPQQTVRSNTGPIFILLAALALLAGVIICGSVLDRIFNPGPQAAAATAAPTDTPTASPTPNAMQIAGTLAAGTQMANYATQTLQAANGSPTASLTPVPPTDTPTATYTTAPVNTLAPTTDAISTTTATPVVVDNLGATMIIFQCGGQIQGNGYVSKYLANTDDGDPAAYTLWMAGQGFNNTTNYQLSFLPPMASLDLEAPEITSWGIKFTATAEQAKCVSDAIAKVVSADTWLYTPNTNGFSSAWHDTISSLWKGGPFVYQEAKIETGGTWSGDLTFTYGPQTLCAPAGGNANAQMYDPLLNWTEKSPRPAYHPAIQGSYCLKTPSMQGTWWTNIGADWDKLVQRWNQTHREVDLRDDHPKIYVFWCGDPSKVPTGFSTEMPQGFSCVAP